MILPEKIISLDFETYYDDEYNLKKKGISTTEYIRDERFKAQCVAIRTEEMSEAEWFRDNEIATALEDLDWKGSALLAHHCHFDGLIASHHYNKVPAYYLCTLSMARPLHGGHIGNSLDEVSLYYGGRGKRRDILEKTKGIRDLPPGLMRKLGEYSGQDVDEMVFIFKEMLPSYTQEELDLIHYTINAYANPILHVDQDIAMAVHKKEIARKKALLEKLNITDRTQLTGREKFAQRLRDAGVEPPMKTSPTTGKQTYAFAKNDIAFQALEEHENEHVRDLVEAKQIVGSSIEETRSARLISHSRDGALPIYLSYGKAHTLRWAGGDKMNPQNFGRESELRNAIIAPPGHRLVICDSAQIEARMNAWLAGETELVEAFRKGDDIYSIFAGEEIYFIAIDQITKEQRFVGKVCILGLGYQMGWKKFKYTLNSGAMGPRVFLPTDNMYADVVRRYRNRYRNIRDQWDTMQYFLQIMWRKNEVEAYGPITFEHETVHLPNGMFLRYPNIRPKWDEIRNEYYDWTYNESNKIYGGLLTENIIQALARIVVAHQILAVAEKYRVVLLVHDEVVLCVPEKQAEDALAETTAAFCIPPDWAPDLPVAGEGTISNCYLKP